MRGLYAHASQRMRDELTAALQARWEQSLRDRAALDPHSPVPLLNNLLAQFRGNTATAAAQPLSPGPGQRSKLAAQPDVSSVRT
jgi:hypothetical protein